MTIETAEQADEVVREADLLKGDDYSSDGLAKQANHIRKHLGPSPSPDAKRLLQEALERRCS